MQVRAGLFALLASFALVASGCGSGGGDDGKDKDGGKGKDQAAETTGGGDDESSAAVKDRQLKAAQKEFEENGDDSNACRNLASAYIAVASPESTGDPKNPPSEPEGAEGNRKEAVKTLERCAELAPTDRTIQNMLATTYMSVGDYDKAEPLLQEIATGARRPDANAFYAWGLAASNAQQPAEAVRAWTRFLELAPKDDPRRKAVADSVKALKTLPPGDARGGATNSTEGEAGDAQDTTSGDEGGDTSGDEG